MLLNETYKGHPGDKWYFDNVNLFSIFCPHKFADYRENHQFKNYKKGEFIYFSEDPSSSIYLLAEGKIKILYYTEEGDEVIKSVLTRMIEFIRELAKEKGESDGPAYRINHFLTHKDMADLIGTTRQTVTTLLNDLRSEGKIDFTRRSMYIPDIKALSSG